MNSIKKKLRGRAGETIAETLVALLISALALLMLAGAVSAGVRIIEQSNNVLYQYYEGNNNLVNYTTPTLPSQPIVITDSAGNEIERYTDEVVSYYVNKLSDKAVIAYSINLPPT